jgi:hypothetical protein
MQKEKVQIKKITTAELDGRSGQWTDKSDKQQKQNHLLFSFTIHYKKIFKMKKKVAKSPKFRGPRPRPRDFLPPSPKFGKSPSPKLASPQFPVPENRSPGSGVQPYIKLYFKN